MTTFKFEAINLSGKTTDGVVEAESSRQARNRLRDMGLTPLYLEPIDEQFINKTPRTFSLKRTHFSSYDLSQLTRQLATLINAGLSIEQSLSATADQLEKTQTKELVLSMRASIIGGSSLSDAMSKYPKIFPDVYCAIVSAGEQSGELSQVLDRLATYTESKETLKQKVIAALVYPGLITLTAILIIGTLLIYVVPQVVSVFEQSKQSLPFLTVAMIAISNFLKITWIYLLIIVTTTVYFFNRAMRSEAFKGKIHRKVLRVPVWGKLILSINTAKFARTLAILTGSGVPILNALNAAYRSTSLIPMREAIKAAIAIVRDGGTLSHALKISKLFPPILVHLIANAEKTGNLEKMLDSASLQQENEVNAKITMLTSLLEPILIMIMGGVVLTIVLAIMLPIIEINQLVH